MKWIITGLKTLAIVIFFVIGVSIGLFIVWKTFIAADAAFINQGVSAFMGAAAVAFFAFVGYWGDNFLRRRSKNHDGLVHLEYTINSIFNIIEDNRILTRSAQESFKANIFHALSFNFYPNLQDLLLSLRNLDLINELFELNTDLRRHNSSYKTLMAMFSDIKELALADRLSESEKTANFAGLNKHLADLQIAIEGLDAKAKEKLCSIRIELRKDKSFTTFFHKRRYGKNHQQEVKKELVKLQDEMNHNREKSREELKKMRLPTEK